MSNVRVQIEMNREELARQVADWSNEEVLAFLQDVDTCKAEWDLISTLKTWVDREHRKMVQEELEVKAQREDRCQQSAEYPDLSHHVNPHKGCVLR